MSDMVTVPMTAQRDIKTVTAEIRTIYEAGCRIELSYAVEIGRRLLEVKKMLPHGEWGNYIQEELPFGRSKAQYLIRIFEEYGAEQASLFGDVKCQTLGNLPLSHALLLLDVPEEDREEFAEEHHVEDLSTRQLQDLIRERDAAKARAENAENLAKKREKDFREKLRESEEKTKQLRERLKSAEEIAKEAADSAERLETEAAEARAQLEEARAAVQPVAVKMDIPAEKLTEIKEEAVKEVQSAAKQAAEKAKKKLDAAEEARTAAEAAKRAAEDEVERLRKQLATADTATVVFQERFSAVQEDFEGLRKAWTAIEDTDKRQKLVRAVQAVLAQQGTVWG